MTPEIFIKQQAAELGFALCGFSPPKIPALAQEQYLAWLANGQQAQMAYMAEPNRVALRLDPAGLLPGARSVVMVALGYAPPAYSASDGASRKECGQIAAYAHGRDYHNIIPKRLRKLAAAITEQFGGEHRPFCDTAPVLEKPLAEQAGLGWIGKNGNLINKELGSWLLIGGLLTTLELTPDAPASNHCGNCKRCRNFCPTDALGQPGVVDGRRCLAYWTIEHRGDIPAEIACQMGNRIFGCDVCQQVCPWNREAIAPTPNLLEPRPENSLPTITSLLALDEAGFVGRFQGTPVMRAKYEGLMRNLRIV